MQHSKIKLFNQSITKLDPRCLNRKARRLCSCFVKILVVIQKVSSVLNKDNKYELEQLSVGFASFTITVFTALPQC